MLSIGKRRTNKKRIEISNAPGGQLRAEGMKEEEAKEDAEEQGLENHRIRPIKLEPELAY